MHSYINTILLSLSIFALSFICTECEAQNRNRDDFQFAIPNHTEISIGVAILDDKGKLVFGINEIEEMPAASSIKALILFELLDKYRTSSDRTVAEIPAILRNAKHPAMAHFSPESKQKIQRSLENVTVEDLGKILVDSSDSNGRKYSNSVYNAASNIAIALLGGPESCTQLIHDRHKSLDGIFVRRYMLAKRSAGDNTATPRSLASFYYLVFNSEAKKINSTNAVLSKTQEILHATTYSSGNILFAKGGTLYSDPVTNVRSGRYATSNNAMNYAILTNQPLLTPNTARAQYEVLSTLSLNIYTQFESRIRMLRK